MCIRDRISSGPYLGILAWAIAIWPLGTVASYLCKSTNSIRLGTRRGLVRGAAQSIMDTCLVNLICGIVVFLAPAFSVIPLLGFTMFNSGYLIATLVREGKARVTSSGHVHTRYNCTLILPDVTTDRMKIGNWVSVVSGGTRAHLSGAVS